MPEGNVKTSIAPMLSVRNGPTAVEFYRAAFGAEVFVFSAIRLVRGLPCFGFDDREADMEIATQWAVLVVATVIAGGAAFAMAGALLSGALRLMQPAGRPAGQPLAGTGRGARLLARG